MSQPRSGVQSFCKFLPTVAEIVEFGNRLTIEAARERAERLKPRRDHIQTVRRPFRPFPQLWKAFGEDYMDGLVRGGISFEILDAACHALVVTGRDAALTALGQEAA